VNHYEVLEVSHGASPEVIRAAYRSLMQRFHPDKNPGDQAVGARAAAIAAAYDILSNADKRAEYDRQLQMAKSQAAVPAERPNAGVAHTSAVRNPARSSAGLGAWWWLLPVVAAMAIGVFAGLKTKGADHKGPEPRAELAAIKQSFGSKTTTESQRRELHARKAELLERYPELLPAASAEAAEERAERTFVLLEGKTVVKIGRDRDEATQSNSAAGIPPMQGELTLHGISLVVGSFDAPEMLTLMGSHKEQLIGDLMARLAKEDLDRFMSPEREAHLKRMVKESVAGTLGTTAQNYPSTYFESPGRYGVVDVLLLGRLEAVRDKLESTE
jgi:curved DNA-binding protein CbpA